MKLHSYYYAVACLALICSAVGVHTACTPKQAAKFVDAADLVCSGLEEYEHLHNAIVSVHFLMERGDYREALKVAEGLLQLFDETHDVKGMNELRALIFLLEGIVKDLPPKEAE